MIVGLDATPLLGPRSGVGRYVEGLLSGLVALTRVAPDPARGTACPEEVVLAAFSMRGRPRLPPARGFRLAPRRLPARLLRQFWSRSELPPVTVVSGRIDLFHATNFVLPPTGPAAGTVVVHDLTYLRMPETVTDDVARYRALVPRSLRRAGGVVTVSHAVAAELVDAYPDVAGRVHVCPLGVDEAWFDATGPGHAERAALGIPDRYLLFVGNAEPRKNLMTLLAALPALAGPVRLVVVGPSGWGGIAEQLQRPGVQRLGFVDDALLRRLVAGAAAVLLPSTYEGFGLPVLEAMAAGTPVVCSDIPALRELAAGHARLVAPDDVSGWAEAMQDALERRPGAEDADRARAHARTFTWVACAERHVRLWRSLAP